MALQSVVCMPNVLARLSWVDTFCLVWGELGTLRQGEVFFPRQFVQASPGESVSLEGDCTACSFARKGPPVPPDCFGISVGAGIPGLTYSVGLGVDNRTGLVCEAGPNLLYTFSASNIEYWVIFGDFQPGWVFDPRYFAVAPESGRQLYCTRPLRLVFPPHVGTLSIVLDSDNVLKMA